MIYDQVSKLFDANFLTEARNDRTVIGLLAAAATLLLVSLIYKRAKSKEHADPVPTVPYTFPIIGSTLSYYKDPTSFARQTAKKYGPVFRVHFQGRLVTVVGAGHVQEVLSHPHLSFVASTRKFVDPARFLPPSRYSLPRGAIRDSILKDLTPKLKDYGNIMFSEYNRIADELLGDQESVIIQDFQSIGRRFIAQSTALAMLGTHLGRNKEILDILQNFASQLIQDLFPGPFRVIFPWFNDLYKRLFYPRYARAKENYETIRQITAPEVQRRLEQANKAEKPDCTLQHMLREYLSGKETALAVDTLAGWILLFSYIGVLTTGSASAGVLYCLAKHPECIPELLAEQDEAIHAEGYGSYDEHPEALFTTAVSRRLVKLDSFIREVFRFGGNDYGHPHTNISDKDIVLSSGAVIRPGDEVYINLQDVHFDPESQPDMKDLDAFKPFRFVGLNMQSTKCSSEYLSFGLGRHACPGRWFAIHQIKALASIMIRKYKMTVVGENTKGLRERRRAKVKEPVRLERRHSMRN